MDSRPDVLLLKARIAIQIQPSGRAHHRYGNCVLKIKRLDGHPPWSGHAKALYGNYLQQTCDRLDDSASWSGRGSQTGKIFSKNLRNSGRTVVCPDGVRTYYSSHPFEPSAYKKRPLGIENCKN